MKTLYRSHFIYTLLLIIIIPIMVSVNFVWFVYNWNDTLFSQLDQNAKTLATAYSLSIAPVVNGQAAELDAKLHSMLTLDPTIRELTVYLYKDNTFVTLATTNQTKQLQLLKDAASSDAWVNDNATSGLQSIESDGHYVWSVLSPLKDSEGKKVGLLATTLTLAQANSFLTQNFIITLAILFATTFVILILVIAHFLSLGSVLRSRGRKDLETMQKSLIFQASDSLQAPLVIINKMYMALLQQGYNHLLDKEGSQYLLGIYNHSNYLTNVTKDLLDLNQLLSGEAKLNKQRVNLVTICHEIVTEQKPAVSSWGIQLSHIAPEHQVMTSVDPDRLKRVIVTVLNLIMQYSGRGKIEISYQFPHPNECSVSIKSDTFRRDSGHGSPNAQYQKTNDELDYFSELGVNYWVSEQIIERLGGTLKADVFPSQGAEFRLTFPTQGITETDQLPVPAVPTAEAPGSAR